MSFDKNVFINCPFDEKYYPLLRPLLFTIVYLEFTPKIALERSDSGESRITKICQLIKDSKYSIHDLSRLKPSLKEYSRQNMPFELGLDIGCRHFSDNHLSSKKCLVLEKEKFRYMKALSDMSGSDIKSHNDDPLKLVEQVRNWFVETVGLKRISSPSVIWYKFNDFMSDFYDKRHAEGFTNEELDMMPIPEYIDYIKEWCTKTNNTIAHNIA